MAEKSIFELASIQIKKEKGAYPEDKKIDVIKKENKIIGYKIFLVNSPEGAMQWLVIIPDAEPQKIEAIRDADSRLSDWPDGEPMMVLTRTKSYGEGDTKPKKEYSLTRPDEGVVKLAFGIIGQ